MAKVEKWLSIQANGIWVKWSCGSIGIQMFEAIGLQLDVEVERR